MRRTSSIALCTLQTVTGATKAGPPHWSAATQSKQVRCADERHPVASSYDGVDRNTTLTSVVGTTTTVVTYRRDATNRVVERDVTTNSALSGQYFYYYGDASTAPAEVYDNLHGKATFYLPGSPGGVTISSPDGINASQWSYPNLHGDDVVVANASGAKVGLTTTYDPFGTPLSALGSNGAGRYNYGYEGQHHIGTDQSSPITLMEMGARVYDPAIGRFIQVDPVLRGSANNYDYVNQDPVNGSDLTGTCYRAGGHWLPCSGDHPYKPPKGKGGPKGPKKFGKGWIDAAKRVWEWDKKGHWDVQAPPGQNGHINVGQDGNLDHGGGGFHVTRTELLAGGAVVVGGVAIALTGGLAAAPLALLF